MSERGILEPVCSSTESALYSSIRIQGYRGLDSFRMQGLGRVNLLVGTNNCGKTSILECIELLRSVRHPHALSSIVARRGEWGYASDQARATVDARLRALYQERLDEALRALEAWCLRSGVEYLRTSTAIAFEDLVLKYLRQSAHLR